MVNRLGVPVGGQLYLFFQSGDRIAELFRQDAGGFHGAGFGAVPNHFQPDLMIQQGLRRTGGFSFSKVGQPQVIFVFGFGGVAVTDQ